MAYRACVLVPYLENHISTADLNEIGRHITAREPRLLWKAVRLDSAPAHAGFSMPALPTMVLQVHSLDPVPWPQFSGPRLTSERVHKVMQLRMMAQAGIPVPRWTRLERGTVIDRETFGEFLIVKPTEKDASRGRGVTLIRTVDFEAYRDRHAAAYEGYRRSPPIVQEFIYTGERPQHTRVLTFLGHIILSYHNESLCPTPFAAPVNALSVTDKVISNAGDRQRKLVAEPDVLDLARRVAAAFPQNVLVGMDIVRHARTGALYVLEANTGNVWLFSNNTAQGSQAYLGRENMKRQFGAPAIVADAIIERGKRELALA